MSGTQDIVLASGIESMTRVPMGSVATLFMKEGLGHYKSERLEEKYPGIMFSQFMGAEMIVKKYGLTKDDLDDYALESHRRGKAATDRKSVVSGKSVSVRVDLGGRRLIQKKIQQQNTQTT